MRSQIIDWIKGFYDLSTETGKDAYQDDLVWWTLGLFGALVIASFVVWLVSRFILIEVMHVVAGKSKTLWDDHLMNNKVFKGLALLVPLMFMEYFLSIAFFHYQELQSALVTFSKLLIILAIMIIINRVFNSIRDIMLEVESLKDKPIQSYTQILKIIVSGVLIIVMFSVVTGKSPIFFLTSLGAISAILLLVFKDTILGFVGSIQLAANDMIRIGDWVTMEKYGADGDVEEINVTTVKVRNFDRTITTIPTYSFISDSFRNWRGMEESDGRRIKRALKIQISTVRFASDELIDKLSRVKVLNDFVTQRQNEIEDYNKKNGFGDDDVINARNQTNFGLFRKYVQYYLEKKQEINTEMTLIVRQLEATEYGIPLEIYCFSQSKEWGIYEDIVADIFDHLFAVLGVFELTAFERPTGKDVKESMSH
ncbi:MAG: mechanosensitive ion channel family protein [Crocinitomicaceae bacterium]